MSSASPQLIKEQEEACGYHVFSCGSLQPSELRPMWQQSTPETPLDFQLPRLVFVESKIQEYNKRIFFLGKLSGSQQLLPTRLTSQGREGQRPSQELPPDQAEGAAGAAAGRLLALPAAVGGSLSLAVHLELQLAWGLGLLGSVLFSCVLTCKHLSSDEHSQNSPCSVAPVSSGSSALKITAWPLLLPLSQ